MNSNHPKALGGPAVDSTMRKASWKWLPMNYQENLTEIRKTRRISSAIETLPEDANASAYFDAKATDLECNCEDIRTELRYFKRAREDSGITDDAYSEIVEELQSSINSSENELHVIKRQKRFLLQDIDEMAAPKSKIRQSWLDLLLDKVALAGAAIKRPKFNQSSFRDNMMDFYGTEKIVEDTKYQYCVVSGEWFPEITTTRGIPKTQIKAAHIVPKALSGPDLDHLFGVGETMLHEARNSLPLLAVIEEALDNGDIAIVPDTMDGPIVLTLKVVLVNEKQRNKPYFGQGKDTRKWNELDNRVLRFLTTPEIAEAQETLPEATKTRLASAGKTPEAIAENRPAQRYLYFRCVVTYLNAKRKVSQDPNLAVWVNKYESKGYMWVTPGKYASQSMLSELLAKIAGDIYLPEAKEIFKPEIPDAAFESEKKNEAEKKQSLEDVKVLAIGLKRKILAHTDMLENPDIEDAENEDGDDDREK